MGVDMNSDDPVYNGIIFKKRFLGSSKWRIWNGVLIKPEQVFGNH